VAGHCQGIGRPWAAVPSHISSNEVAAAIIAELDEDDPRNVGEVPPVQRAQLHLFLSIARPLDDLFNYGIDVSSR